MLMSSSISTLVYGYANINTSPPPHAILLFCCANIKKNKKNNTYIMFDNLIILSAFFLWNVGLCLGSGIPTALWIATFCKVAWH